METTCNTCGASFTASRSDAKYCSPKCRTHAHRVRHGVAQVQVRRAPMPPMVLSAVIQLDKASRKLAALAKDDRYRKSLDEYHVVRMDGIRARLENL